MTTAIRRHPWRSFGALILMLVAFAAAPAGAGELTFSLDGYQTVAGGFSRPGPVLTGLDGKIYVVEFWYFFELRTVSLGSYAPLTGEVAHVPLPVTGPSDSPTSLTQLPDGTILVSSVNSFPGKLIVVPPGGGATAVSVSGIERGPATIYYHRGTGTLLATDVFADRLYELTRRPDGGYAATLVYQSSTDLEFSNAIAELPSDPDAAYLLVVGGVDRVALTDGTWMRTASYGLGQEMFGIVGTGDGRILAATSAGAEVWSLSVPSGLVTRILTISGIGCSASLPGLTLTDGHSRLWGVAVSDCSSLEALATSGKIWAGPLPAPIIAVTIDVHPGSSTNGLNPNSHGVTPVAILTTDVFDASRVDPSTVRFGATGAEAGPVHVALEDVDGDGRLDLVLLFRTQDTGIVCGGTSAALTGQTWDGRALGGSDSISTVDCK